MNQQEIDQIHNIISNFEEKNAFIPFLADLMEHDVFWPIFKGLDESQREEVVQIIRAYIIEKIWHMSKTKWGQLFKRFFETSTDLFWDFRFLNEESRTQAPEFQTLWKQVEQEIFKLEWILTEKMFKQEKGLDKVIGSFYNIVYNFFPKYGLIE